MIAKPCPGCGRDDAGCGCAPYHLTVCINCGATVHGRRPRYGCHKCSTGQVLDLEDLERRFETESLSLDL